MTSDPSESIRDTVRQGYAEIARSGSGCCARPSSCCGSSSPDRLAQAIGYTADELKTLPDGANMGLSCGNPTAIAELKPGQVVLDLGSGGGFDVFIAAKKVGPAGRAIGVDMTPEMVAKARAGIGVFQQKTGLKNVEFRLGEIEHLPVADSSVDVVISNCVINLSPDKPQVWREIARVLRPGGRVAVSDLALLRPLPEAIRESIEALVGCVAGAALVDETRAMVGAAGLTEAAFREDSQYIDSMASWSDPVFRGITDRLPPGTKLGDYVTSLSITAAKPGALLAEQTRELIAVGASVTAHCQPCLTYHVDKARQVGIGEQEIREAIAVGHQVEKGSMSAMAASARSVLDPSTPSDSACCAGRTSPDGTSCCS